MIYFARVKPSWASSIVSIATSLSFRFMSVTVILQGKAFNRLQLMATALDSSNRLITIVERLKVLIFYYSVSLVPKCRVAFKDTLFKRYVSKFLNARHFNSRIHFAVAATVFNVLVFPKKGPLLPEILFLYHPN